MAEAGVNISPSTMESGTASQDESVRQSVMSGIEFQASQVIERLEEAVEKAEDGGGGPTAGQSWKNSHAFLPLPSKPTEEILSMLEDMIIHEDSGSPHDTPEEEGLVPSVAPLPQLDPAARLAVVTHSVAAFASGLERSHLQHLCSRITSDTTRWLSHLFRFFDCAAFIHDDMLEGVVRITRMMLHYKYPKYLEDGFDALTSHPPVIYSSVASPLGVVQHICRQLGLPMYCVRPVPCNTLFGSQQKIDVAALERLIDEDKANNRVPLIVLADAGTTIAGHVDNVLRLQELCKQHDIWLHLRGHSLAALAMVSVQNVPTRIADSFTLPLGIWLGIPALPIVTLYRLFDSSSTKQARPMSTVGVPRESTLPLVAGLTADHFTRRLSCLSLWSALQALGRDGVQTKVREAFESSEQMWKKISKYPCLRLLSQQPGGEAGTFMVAELISKPVSTAVLLEVVACTVVFQFVPESSEGDTGGRVPSYYDKLNSWDILLATVQHKETFQRLVTASPRLRLVDMPGWAGLGGVRYVPEGWEQLMTDQAKEELNRLNMQLVEQLRNTDAAFSLGEGTDGLVCVRFGMVTVDTDVEDLLGLVVTVGREVEESSRFLETMTEIVKKGIEAATLDLQKENEERLWQEGILRHVPVFGSLVNWWSPPSKETGIKGRSLNLTAGVVESTENIYRYHMQLQQGVTAPPGTRSPPQPQVQTPVAPSASGKHSRSSSHSSQQSQSQPQTIPNAAVMTTSPEVVLEPVSS
ncbi:Pyridoxal-dependent decarboxylase domain-containing protein 1 [Blattella germanica]|nr:Pyridoxal-dependent decarboxylase domain-containing protein 1 [Blattella germanica]